MIQKEQNNIFNNVLLYFIIILINNYNNRTIFHSIQIVNKGIIQNMNRYNDTMNVNG